MDRGEPEIDKGRLIAAPPRRRPTRHSRSGRRRRRRPAQHARPTSSAPNTCRMPNSGYRRWATACIPGISLGKRHPSDSER